MVSAIPHRIQAGAFYLSFENSGASQFGGGTGEWNVRLIGG